MYLHSDQFHMLVLLCVDRVFCLPQGVVQATCILLNNYMGCRHMNGCCHCLWQRKAHLDDFLSSAVLPPARFGPRLRQARDIQRSKAYMSLNFGPFWFPRLHCLHLVEAADWNFTQPVLHNLKGMGSRIFDLMGRLLPLEHAASLLKFAGSRFSRYANVTVPKSLPRKFKL